MSVQPQELHVVFLPFPAHGHMIPILDIAQLFAARDGVKATIITTPLNVSTFTNKNGGPTINIEVFRFPAEEAGLSEEIELPDPSKGPELIQKFFKANDLLSKQLEQYLERVRPTPNCIIADMFFPWATECAAKFDIPRLVFHGTNNFSLCADDLVRAYEPFNKVSSDEESFIIPYLPHEVKLTRLQLPEYLRNNEETELKRKIEKVKESEVTSYGVIVNSFHELEPDYAEFYRKELERRAWNIGPVSLRNRSAQGKAQRGKQASIDEHQCLKWLNSKNPNSVVYICFGSVSSSIDPQLHEIAMALEASGHNFIWVIRNNYKNEKNEEWLPEGFEERTEGKGLIIRGWAPQVLILEHEAIGAFVTHCGWNSTLEGITAGVPMVTWPMFAEQFYNEKLVTEILKIGIPVGVKKWCGMPSLEDVIKKEAIKMVLRKIMEGNEVEERKRRVKKLMKMAREAVEEGGSSYYELSVLILELSGLQLLESKGEVLCSS